MHHVLPRMLSHARRLDELLPLLGVLRSNPYFVCNPILQDPDIAILSILDMDKKLDIRIR